MLELGYATHVVGWDRVIGVLNSGKRGYGFDIKRMSILEFDWCSI